MATPLIQGETISLYVNKHESGIEAMQTVASITTIDDEGQVTSGIRLEIGTTKINYLVILPFSLLKGIGLIDEDAPDGFALIDGEELTPFYLSSAVTYGDVDYSEGWTSAVAEDGYLRQGKVQEIQIVGNATRAMFDSIFSSTPFGDDDNNNDDNNNQGDKNMINKKEFLTDKQILINQDSATRIGCLVSKTGVIANDDGDYIVKAGTPLYGTDVGMNRDIALTIVSTGTSPNNTTVQGILNSNVVFKKGATTANGTLVIDGTVDYLKLDSDVQALITSTVKSTLTDIHFIKGDAN